MFLGRERELSTLERLYRSDKFAFAVIYGRRRVGKTALIGEFAKGKDTIFFTGVETNAKQNLENFSAAILEASLISFSSCSRRILSIFMLESAP